MEQWSCPCFSGRKSGNWSLERCSFSVLSVSSVAPFLRSVDSIASLSLCLSLSLSLSLAQPETSVTKQTGYMGDTLLKFRSRLLLRRRNDDQLWECGNLAFCARFPSPCGNRFVVSTGTPFPQLSSPPRLAVPMLPFTAGADRRSCGRLHRRAAAPPPMNGGTRTCGRAIVIGHGQCRRPCHAGVKRRVRRSMRPSSTCMKRTSQSPRSVSTRPTACRRTASLMNTNSPCHLM